MKTKKRLLLLALSFLTLVACHSGDPGSHVVYIAPPVDVYQGYWSDQPSFHRIKRLAELNDLCSVPPLGIETVSPHILRIDARGNVDAIYFSDFPEKWGDDIVGLWTFRFRHGKGVHRIGEVTADGYLMIEGEVNPSFANQLNVRIHENREFILDANSYSLEGPFHRISPEDFQNFQSYIRTCMSGGPAS